MCRKNRERRAGMEKHLQRISYSRATSGEIKNMFILILFHCEFKTDKLQHNVWMSKMSQNTGLSNTHSGDNLP